MAVLWGEQERPAGVADWDGQDALPALLEPGLAGADQGRQPARQDQGRRISEATSQVMTDINQCC
jgi:hypothetical protein